MLTIGGLISLWFAFSLLLSLYNKWMFAPGHLNFPFPLFVTSVHMVIQFFLSWFVLWWFPKYRPQRKDYLSLKEYTYAPAPNPTSTDGQVEDWAVWHRDGDGYWFVECVIAIYHTGLL